MRCSVIIPGNHDGDPQAFFSVFGTPQKHLDIAGVRFAAFVDEERPGWNAFRSEHDLRGMKELRAGFDGPIVALQHVPLFPPGAVDCPYNLTNAHEAIEAMRESAIFLSIGGHFHRGTDLLRTRGASFVVAPALCESPFQFLEIRTDGREINVRRHELGMQDRMALADAHVHTQFAYCSENMSMEKALELADLFGLADIAFTEHSGQLYFNEKEYWSGRYFREGVAGAVESDNRMADYFAAVTKRQHRNAMAGLEVDCDFQGNPVLLPADHDRARVQIGAVHRLSELDRSDPDEGRAGEEFLGILSRFLRSGIQVLAHPFRVFGRAGLDAPASLFEPTVELLRENKVAAEINFHTNEPPPKFARLCLDRGVELSFGSDAHNLYEVGEFAPHLALLESCGFDGDLGEILVNLRR